jgi:hypothetical protein
MISGKNVGSQFNGASGQRTARYNPADWGFDPGPKGKVSLKNRLRGDKPDHSWREPGSYGPHKKAYYDQSDW